MRVLKEFFVVVVAFSLPFPFGLIWLSYYAPKP